MLIPKISKHKHFCWIVPEDIHNELGISLYLWGDLIWRHDPERFYSEEEAEKIIHRYIQEHLKLLSNIIAEGFDISNDIP